MEQPKPNIIQESRPAWLFYDGACGLCHHSVRFAAERDISGKRFRFAPLGGKRFFLELNESTRKSLPDSIVVLRPDRRLAVRSDAIVYILWELGGIWAALSLPLQILPRPIRDFFYDLVARFRKRIFAKPDSTCPLMPSELQARFDLEEA